MIDVSGLVMTKLDGSAKGGVVVALAESSAYRYTPLASVKELMTFAPLSGPSRGRLWG